MTQSILLATDLSANAAFAARWAKHYADAVGAEVILAHIIEINVPNWLRDAYNVLEDDEKRAKMEARITEWYTTHAKGEHGGILIAAGNITDQLASMAEEVDASLIVLAKSGKSALTRFLAGSTAQMMCANPPRPIVVVHPDHTSLGPETKIAVATDLTVTAEKALTAAGKLAQALGSNLDILHASAATSASFDADDLPEELRDANLSARAQEQLDKTTAALTTEIEGLQAKPHLLHASPVEGIASFVEEHHTDIVLVGNAAHYNVLTNVFGRVSVKLMQTLDCTFVVIPPDVLSEDAGSEEE